MEKQYSTVMAEQDESEGIELGELLAILLSNIKLIVISTLVAGLLVFLVSAFVVTPMYTAGISIYVNNATNTNVNANKIESADINASQLLVNTYITIVQSNRVLNDVAKECGGTYTANEIKSMMVATAVQNTEIFRVTIENEDPKAAANIANQVAGVALKKIPEYIEGSSVKVVDYAFVPQAPSSPNVLLNTAIGLMMGLILSVLFALAREMLDTRIKVEGELESMFDLPVLGKIGNFVHITDKKSTRGYGYGYKRHHEQRTKETMKEKEQEGREKE